MDRTKLIHRNAAEENFQSGFYVTVEELVLGIIWRISKLGFCFKKKKKTRAQKLTTLKLLTFENMDMLLIVTYQLSVLSYCNCGPQIHTNTGSQ